MYMEYSVWKWLHPCTSLSLNHSSNIKHLTQSITIMDILPKEPYLPCVSMAGRALLAEYYWYQTTPDSIRQDTSTTGLILGLCPANEKHHYKVTPSLIGWAQTQNQPCTIFVCLELSSEDWLYSTSWGSNELTWWTNGSLASALSDNSSRKPHKSPDIYQRKTYQQSFPIRYTHSFIVFCLFIFVAYSHPQFLV